MEKTLFSEIMKTNTGYASKYSPEEDSLQDKAKSLCYEINNTNPKDNAKRMSLFKQLFGSCECDIALEPSFHCDYGYNIHFKGFALINYNCVILDTSPVNIGNCVFIAPNVCITCVGHALVAEERVDQAIQISKPINIGDKVWIGANTTICGGVTIGEGSVIGAGSVVCSDIPAGVVAVGSPCRPVRKITDEDRINMPKDIKVIKLENN